MVMVDYRASKGLVPIGAPRNFVTGVGTASSLSNRAKIIVDGARQPVGVRQTGSLHRVPKVSRVAPAARCRDGGGRNARQTR